MVVDAFFLFDEVIVVAILSRGVGRGVSGGGELHLGDEQPLEEGEPYSDDGAHRDQNLGSEIWEYRCPHGCECTQRELSEREGKRKRKKEESVREMKG